MANYFSYNGIVIPYSTIEVIQAEAIYDSADAGVMYTRMRFRVSGTVQYDDTYTMSQNMVFFRQQLLIPRQAIQIVASAGDSDYVLNLPSGDNDAGPKPRSCSITEIIGTNFCSVRFEIDVAVQESCTSTSNVLSHAYQVTHSLDNRFYTTRTVTGTLRVDQQASSNNPDALRGLVVPALPAGFQREAMSFAVSRDGLQLDYVITDKEKFRVPPLSGSQWAATFTVQMSNYIWYNHFRIEVRGNKNQDQLSMFNDCMLLAATRIDFSTEFIQQATIEEELGDNVVRVQISTMATGAPTGPINKNMVPPNTAIFTSLGAYEVANAVALGPYGSAMIEAAKTAFYSPCLNDQPPTLSYAQLQPSTNPSSTTASGSTATVGNSSFSSSWSDTPPAIITASDGGNPYIHYEQLTEFRQVNGMVVLPSTQASIGGQVYQFHNPYMEIHQYGSATRINALPTLPDPQVIGSAAVQVRVKTVTPSAPYPLPDKQSSVYGIKWDYEIVVPLADSDLQNSDSGFVDTTFSDGDGTPYATPINLAMTDPGTGANAPPSPSGGNAYYADAAPITVDPVT